MSTFSAVTPSIVYDIRSALLIRWDLAWAEDYQKRSSLYDFNRGIIQWDGLLLAGWFPEEDAASLSFPADRSVTRIPAGRVASPAT